MIRRIYATLCLAAMAVESFSPLPQQLPLRRHTPPTAPTSSSSSSSFSAGNAAVPTRTTTPDATSSSSSSALQAARTYTRRKTKSQRTTSSSVERNSPSSSTSTIEIDGDYPLLSNPSSSSLTKSSISSSSLDRYPCLVLNADYQPLSYMPLSLWSWQDAIKSVFLGKVTVVDVYPDKAVRAARVEFPLPSVIAVTEYVHPSRSTPAFTRGNVLLRDEYRCQYCHERFQQIDLSLDHVVPRSMGGRLSWTNAVACCRHCNGRKGCKSVGEIQRELGMTLLRKPVAPTQYELSKIAARLMAPRRVHGTWKPYLYGGGGGGDLPSHDEIRR